MLIDWTFHFKYVFLLDVKEGLPNIRQLKGKVKCFENEDFRKGAGL